MEQWDAYHYTTEDYQIRHLFTLSKMTTLVDYLAVCQISQSFEQEKYENTCGINYHF